MSGRKNDAQTVAFFWRPFVYPMQWAERPEDVPDWDMTRGCPWDRWQPHEDTYYQRVLNIDRASGYGRWEHDPDGSKPDWEVTPPPATGYPRLVRRSLKDRVIEAPRTRDDVVGELALKMFRDGVNAWRDGKQTVKLKEKVLELSERYGPVWSMEDNTLEAWLACAAFVQAHMRASEFLEERSPFFAESDDYTSDVSTVDKLRLEKERLEAKRGAINGGVNALNGLDAVDRAELSAFLSLYRAAKRTETEEKPVEAFRLEVSQDLYGNKFGEVAGRGKDEHLAFRNAGVVLRCSVGKWVFYKLAEWWRHGSFVRICPACRTLFPPSRSNKKYCCDNCRKEKSRKGIVRATRS